MTDKQKKQKERRYLMRFKEVCSAFPDGEVRDCERPDFIISRTEGDLGIEITQLFQTPAPSKRPLQEQESLRKRIVDEAQSQYNLLGNRPIWVTIYFNHNYLLKKRDVKALGDKVAGIVQRNIPSLNGPAKDEVYDWVNRDYFPEQISRVSVRNGRKNLWSPSDFGFFPSLTPKEIQTKLNDKNKRALLERCLLSPPGNKSEQAKPRLTVSRWIEPPRSGRLPDQAGASGPIQSL